MKFPGMVDSPRGRFQLTRAWPRPEGHLLLELHDTSGRPVGGQWHPTVEAAEKVTRKLGAPAFHVGSVVVQPDGVDGRLPALAGEVATPGQELVTHRPGKRAVLRRRDEEGSVVSYRKVVRPSRAAALAARGVAAAQKLHGIAAVPKLLDDERVAQGVLEWSVVEGRTLHDLGTDPSWTADAASTAWGSAGDALLALHTSDPAGLDGWHGADDELAALLAWVEPAVDFGLLDGELALRATGNVEQLLLETADPVVGVLHRDLHDKQLLLDEQGRLGLIDVDTLARGERALDIANVLAHLELRQAQGLLQGRHKAAAEEAFLTASGASDVPRDRIGAYLLATRLRLAGVYAFRPKWRQLARQLLQLVAMQDIPR